MDISKNATDRDSRRPTNMAECAQNIIDLRQKLVIRCEATFSNEMMFNVLSELVGPDIMIRYEIVSSFEEDVIASLAGMPVTKMEKTKNGKFSHLNGLTIGRILLTTHRLNGNFSSELVRQCNGVIIEFGTWRILAMPSPMFNPRFRTADITNNLSSYNIYEVKDGTTVTLYWYNNEWCVSSTNGYDVKEYQLLGSTTYMDAINAAVAAYPEFSFDNLNNTCSYTIGFRHEDFQPLRTDPRDVWLVQTCDIDAINAGKLAINVNCDIGIPQQAVVVFPQVAEAASAEKTLTHSELMDIILARNASAVTEYTSAVAGGLFQGVWKSKPPNIHYGYVLRAAAGSNLGAFENILLESELLKNIRGYVYNIPKKRLGKCSITSEFRIEFIALRAYLSNITKFAFISLFPQFAYLYKKYDGIFEKLVNRIISCLRGKDFRKTSGGLTPMDRLVVGLTDHVRQSGINASDPESFTIIQDFLLNRDHLDLYYECIIITREK